MNAWCVKKITWGLAFLLAGVFAPVCRADVEQDLVNQAQTSLQYWDVAAAKSATQDLAKRRPNDDVTFYLTGAIAFYEGRYADAKAAFSNVKKIARFENGPDGFAGLTQEILAQKFEFQAYAGPRFTVHAAGVDQVMVPYLQARMDLVREAIGKALGYFPKESVLIEIYPSADAFIAASPLSEAEVKNSGTIALCKYGRVLLTTPRSLLRGYPWLETASHEYVHYVITRKWGSNVPVWLHEGLAKYLESRWRTGEAGGTSTMDPSSQSLLARALARHEFVTFDQMHPSFAKLPSADTAQLAYAQVESLVDYLVRERGGWPTVQALLDQLAKGESYQNAFQTVLGVSTERLLSDWKKWLATLHLREIKGLDPYTLQIVEPQPVNGEKAEKISEKIDREELSQIRAASVRDQLHLGDLLRYRGRLAAAVREYERAQKQAERTGGPLSPIIATKLAQAYHQSNQGAKAEAILKETVLYYPHYGQAYLILGDVQRERKAWQQAAQSYESALEVNPFNPQVYANLASVYRELGDQSDLARAGLARAEKSLSVLRASR